MNSVTCWNRHRVGTTVTIGVTACSGGSSNPASTTPTTPAPTASAPTRAGHAPGVIGQITAENGSTWTLKARNGTPYTVTITPQTQFGTRRTPGTAQQFPLGSTVRVSGIANGTTITASRITTTRSRHAASATPTPPPS